MGRITTLYGFIQEYPDRGKEYSTHNRRVLENLPIKSDYPYLNRGMFYGPKGNMNTEQISYWGKLILFGGSFKAIEDYWEEWIQKFEILLIEVTHERSNISYVEVL
ncbi:MAG: hypothetical protein AAFY76_05865 [Cyanobacteria bacterium J06649_11]